MIKNKKRGLGKGLEALIPEMSTLEQVEEEISEDRIKHININKIYPNVHQPRKDFDEDSIMELAQSIKVHGIIQPIIVTERKDGYMIIAGERRWRASKELQLREIPCVIKNYEDSQLMKVALVENLQRENLNPIEEALAYKDLINNHKVTQEQLAEALGKSRPYLANTLRLLNLDGRIIDLVKSNSLSSGHGRVLLRIDDGEKQYQIALKIMEEKLSVRETEDLIGKILMPPKKKGVKKKSKDYLLIDVEDTLKKALGTKVTISKGKNKGKIEIEYYNNEDLERILDIIANNTK
ncbi:ParB/RepB/Spo0J family partition protein [Alkaliphilus serpentinus]|uniref:ParB/RepB/Spo0J family partition protein n=1 Tax=Alkaliphilus serpentinus TaxID=1482731 RepID=A0A833MB44_9FIRM|nr:ParB/RepB/Spo0J family partition protein [Alkaliphilus serpentinus]KAB3532211.1 ParB/RepB/Spo0J family partition protein [Alkaliphilus serpentinus]